MSCARNIQSLYLLHKLQHQNFKFSDKVKSEMQHLQASTQWKMQYALLFPASNDITICSLNTRNLILHAEDISHHHSLITDTVLFLRETRAKNTEHLALLNHNFNCYSTLSIHGILTCWAKTCILQKTQTFATNHLESITID